jgi:hypothetical protein
VRPAAQPVVAGPSEKAVGLPAAGEAVVPSTAEEQVVAVIARDCGQAAV